MRFGPRKRFRGLFYPPAQMNAEMGNPFASVDVREEKLNLRINLPCSFLPLRVWDKKL